VPRQFSKGLKLVDAARGRADEVSASRHVEDSVLSTVVARAILDPCEMLAARFILHLEDTDRCAFDRVAKLVGDMAGHYARTPEDQVRAIANFSGSEINPQTGVHFAFAAVAGDVTGFERAQSKAVCQKTLKRKPALVVADSGA